VTERSQKLLCFQYGPEKTKPIPLASGRLKAGSEGAPLVGGTTCPTTQSWCREYGFDPFGNRSVSHGTRQIWQRTGTEGALIPRNFGGEARSDARHKING
jgi:hypothetical protein